jgi:signal transduction histidine kinase
LTNNRRRRRLSERYESLYFGLFANIILGALLAALTYGVIAIATGLIIDFGYSSEASKDKRREKYAAELQEYVDESAISSGDTESLSKWASDNKYVYVLLYKDGELVFSPDMKYDEAGIAAGMYPNRDELIGEALANEPFAINMADGTVFASFSDYSVEFVRGAWTLVAIFIAFLVLTTTLITYLRQVIGRIKRLESDVTVVSYVNMNHRVECEGEDEIARLSKNVETMRHSLIESIEKEKDAREANTELVTSMSHDIRTPLTVLMGYLEMMRERVGDDEVMRGYVQASEKTATRLKELSDDMFKYALAFGDTGKGVVLEEYEAQTLILQLLSEHLVLLAERGYTHRLTSIPSFKKSDMRLTDPQNLMRIIDNIFSNLYKYADINEPVEISVERDERCAIIRFKNKIKKNTEGAESNGIGIKTCQRLAEFVLEKFEYENDGEYYSTMLAIKMNR